MPRRNENKYVQPKRAFVNSFVPSLDDTTDPSFRPVENRTEGPLTEMATIKPFDQTHDVTDISELPR